MVEKDARVIVNGEIRKLGGVSEIVSALRGVHDNEWHFGVYTPEEHIEKVNLAAESVF